MAVVEIGIMPDQYAKLSFYEYTLLVERYNKQAEKEKNEWETRWEQTRQLWLPLVSNFKKEGGGKFTSQDLIKLSYDNQDKTERKITLKEAKQMLGSKFKPIKRDGNK